MTSNMMTIADHMASDFREAVMEAEKADRDAIDKMSSEFNLAYVEYTNKDAVLSSRAEQAVRTLMEIAELRDVNHTTYSRRLQTIKEQMAAFKETKVPALDPEAQFNQALNVVKLGG